jgi:predicted TPR repeat methyltransferase
MEPELASAIALHKRGELDAAEKIYESILEADEDNPEALHFLGVLRHQQGRSLTGVDLVRRALALRPDYVDALNNLGNIQQQLDCPMDAIASYRCALELQPDHPDALRNLGIALRKVKRHQQGAELLERAIEQSPEKVENYYSLASSYRELSRFEDAVATLCKALAIRAEPEGFERLGRLLTGLRRMEQAAATYEAWLEVEPDNPVPKHMLAACTRKDVPQRAGDDYVQRVFDSFAGDFDQVLGKLEYRAPALVGAALRRIEAEPRGELAILDAGCGTGLLAPHLRPYAGRLVGVDLSLKMLEKAAKRALYDELVASELTAYLRSLPQAFDVVASSDTLVYFGDLREVLAAAAAALRPGGRLVFTLEHAREEEAEAIGYRIHPHGRYSHGESYVRRTLVEAGFAIVEIEREQLRRESAVPVAGMVIAARKPAGAQNLSEATAADPLAAAVALHRQGKLDEAEALYQDVLQADPKHAEALHYLGLVRFQQRRWYDALKLARRAIDAAPNSVEPYINLGNTCVQLGLVAAAAQAYESAVELWPDHPEAAPRLAAVEKELARLEESVQTHRRALEREPANADHLYALAGAYEKMGRDEESFAILREALAIRPHGDAFRRVGAALCAMGRLDEAVATYDAWLRAEPDNPIARHLLAACTGNDVPERAGDAFVAREFDRFAERFDEVLARLEYRAPALIAGALERIYGPARGALEVLDAGCGTGLAAAALRPYARRLAGVDLSTKMLEKAAGRGLYDSLTAAELSSHLRSCAQAFDLVAASDTLNYFGDLREVFGAAGASLRPGGWLLFTLEHAADEALAPARYRLHPDGRYMHTEAYVRETLAAAGFEAIAIERAVLRREGESYVAGLIAAACRRSTDQ